MGRAGTGWNGLEDSEVQNETHINSLHGVLQTICYAFLYVFLNCLKNMKYDIAFFLFLLLF